MKSVVELKLFTTIAKLFTEYYNELSLFISHFRHKKYHRVMSINQFEKINIVYYKVFYTKETKT